MSRLLYERIINDAIKETARKIFGKVPEITKIGETKSPISVESFNVILGIVGDITGQIIFNFKGESPQKIVSIPADNRRLNKLFPSIINLSTKLKKNFT